MKKNTTLLVIAIVISLAVIGCASGGRSFDVSLRPIQDTGIYHTPMVADLDVDNTMVTGRATGTPQTVHALEQLKAQAYENALQGKNAHALVEPRFEISWTSRGLYTVIVRGFPATYKNIRKLEIEDSTLWQGAGK